MENPPPQVVNLHWTGGLDKGLPENTKFIGRPSEFGNLFHHKGDQTREEAVARHRLWLHGKIKKDPEFAKSVMDLKGFNLGCWCKNPHRFVCCHGDNLLREINWLSEDGWVPGKEITHGFGLMDEYVSLRNKLSLIVKEDNLLYALMDAFIEIECQIVILPEVHEAKKLLFILAYAVTHLNVAYELYVKDDDRELILYHILSAEYHASQYPFKTRVKPPKGKKTNGRKTASTSK